MLTNFAMAKPMFNPLRDEDCCPIVLNFFHRYICIKNKEIFPLCTDILALFLKLEEPGPRRLVSDLHYPKRAMAVAQHRRLAQFGRPSADSQCGSSASPNGRGEGTVVFETTLRLSILLLVRIR